MASEGGQDGRRRLENLALVMPLFGLLLLLPPVLWVFGAHVRVFGLPLELIYVFGVCGLLIIGTALMARRLDSGVEATNEAADAPPTPEKGA